MTVTLETFFSYDCTYKNKLQIKKPFHIAQKNKVQLPLNIVQVDFN